MPPAAPQMRRLLSAVAAAALLVSLAVPASAGTRTVRVGDNWYKPRTLTVKRNTTVKWRFVGRAPHTVTVRRGPVRFSSRLLREGTYRKRLRRRGTYRIYCKLHGTAQSMTLRVR